MAPTMLDDKTLVIEVDAAGEEDYRWSVFGVFRDGGGRLYVADDGGCSCNYAWDREPNYSPAASFAEAEQHAREWASGYVPTLERVDRAFREYRANKDGA